MKKQAVLFPGQGCQFDEMGVDWCRNFASARLIYEEAADVLGLNVLKLSGEGVAFHRSTHKGQIAVFVHSIAIWKVLHDQGVITHPIFSGMSLGEFSGLIASNRAQFCELLPLIDRRATLMQRACELFASGMAAVSNIKEETILELVKAEKCCDRVWIANFNSPSQVVISGQIDSLDRVCKALIATGGRVQRLQVAGAFHTPLMLTAQREWLPQWHNFHLKSSAIEFVSSTSGKKESDIATLHKLIGDQMVLPVRWTAAAKAIELEKPTLHFEVGSKVLAGLHRRIDKSAKVISIQRVVDLARLQKGNID